MKRRTMGAAQYGALAMLLTMAISGSAIAQSDAPPAEKLSAQQYIHSLAPTDGSGPGIFVGEPVPVHADQAVTDFGAGCSAWLLYALGSQGQLGQTPTYSYIENDRRWVLNKPNMRLLPQEAKAVAIDLGLSHIVTATVSGSAALCHLVYTIRKRDGSPLGAPITLGGQESQIIDVLPRVASAIAVRIAKPGPAPIPPLGGLLPEDMELIGRSRRNYSAKISDDDVLKWWLLAAKSPLGGIFRINNNHDDLGARDRLLEQAGGNPLVLAALSEVEKPARPVFKQAVTAASSVFPRNSAIAHAQSMIEYWADDHAAERSGSERAVRLAPNSPHAWMYLASALRDQIRYVRHDGSPNGMTPAQEAFVHSATPLWIAVAKRATEISPQDGIAWRYLANAARYGADPTLIDRAMTAALKYAPGDQSVYRDGMRIYTSTNQEKALDIAQRAIAKYGIDSFYDDITKMLDWVPDNNPKTILLQKQMRQFSIDHGLNAVTRPLWNAAQADQNSTEKWVALWKALNEQAHQTQQSRFRYLPGDRKLRGQMNFHEQRLFFLLFPLRSEVARRLVKLEPGNADNWTRLIMSDPSPGNIQTGITEALKIDPANIDVYWMGLEYYQPKWTVDYPDLIQLTEDAEARPEIFPKVAGHIILAMQESIRIGRETGDQTAEQLAKMQDLLNKAQHEMEVVSATETNDPALLESLVDYAASQRDYRKAAEICRKWIKAAPDNPEAEINLGLYSASGPMKDLSVAIPAYQSASALDPKNAETISALLNLQLSQNQDADIEPTARRLTSLAPLRALGHYALGRALIANHKYAEAKTSLQKAFDLDPDNLDHGLDAASLLASLQTPNAHQQEIVAAWKRINEFAQDIGVGPGGAIWIAATDGPGSPSKAIYRWSTDHWERVPGAADRIAVDPDGLAWIITPSHNIARWKGGQWQTLPGSANDIGIGPDGSVWIIGTRTHSGGYSILHWNGNGWDTSSGAGKRIAVDTYGKPWLVNTASLMFYKTNGKWRPHGGEAIDIGAGLDGALWALQTPNGTDTRKLLHWNGRSWDNLPGQGIAISVGPNGLPWIVCADGTIQAGPTL